VISVDVCADPMCLPPVRGRDDDEGAALQLDRSSIAASMRPASTAS
jgi:hypothetical protein